MKKTVYILVFLLVICVPNGWSKNKYSIEDNHFVSVWGDVGYASLLNNASAVKNGVGFSPAIGVGYRFVKHGFILQAGVEGQYAYLTHKINIPSLVLPMQDTEGDPFEMIATIQQYKDITQVMNVNIPVLLGYEHQYVYFLAGASVGLNVWSAAKAKSAVTSQGRYAIFIDPFEDMPNHNLNSDQSQNSGSYQIDWNNPSVNLHAEIGGRVDFFSTEKGGKDVFAHKYRIYVGVFAEYGILNVHGSRSNNSILGYHQDPGQPLMYDILPVMVSSQMNDVRVNPLVVGVKATLLWQLPKKKICIMCKD